MATWEDAWRTEEAPPAAPAPQPIAGDEVTQRYAHRAVEAESERVRGAAKGERNHVLNDATFALARFVANGVLAYQYVHDTMLSAAMACGLGRQEAERTIGSAFRGAANKPRPIAPNGLNADAVDVAEVALAELVGDPDRLGASELFGNAEQLEDAGGERPRTSWWAWPVEQIARGQESEPEPDIGVRTDGCGLFYRGKINGLIGESESGKSWLSLHAAHQVAASGERVLIFDFEDTARTTRERLAALGCTAEAMQRVAYASPDQSLDALASSDVAEVLRDWRPTLIIVDGLNAAMTLLGLDLNSNTDATTFHVRLLRPLAATGAAVLTVDHVPKNPEQRGKGGIGAQAKRAMMTGCTIRVEVSEPFGRGSDGRLKLYVDKDRPGHVRGHSGNGKYAGTFIIESHDDDIRAHIEAPDINVKSWRPTATMEAISNLLRAQPMGQNAIEGMVAGRAKTVRDALRHLVEDGYVRVESGPNRQRLHHLIRPYASGVEEVAADGL
ncbi:MAG: AAA family ATPase [Micropruina sp.]